jgi:signal peptidase II
VAAILALLVLYRRTAPEARLRAAALALVAGGAMGNLLDRLRSPLGVVDFIDVGIGDARFWTFNVADVGVTAKPANITRDAAPKDRFMAAPGL